MATLYAFNRADQPEKSTLHFFPNVHLAAAPAEPALRDTQFGEHLGEVLSLASFRTKPMQAVSH